MQNFIKFIGAKHGRQTRLYEYFIKNGININKNAIATWKHRKVIPAWAYKTIIEFSNGELSIDDFMTDQSKKEMLLEQKMIQLRDEYRALKELKKQKAKK